MGTNYGRWFAHSISWLKAESPDTSFFATLSPLHERGPYTALSPMKMPRVPASKRGQDGVVAPSHTAS